MAEDLIVELYSDVKSYIRREDITRDVTEIYLQRGGLETSSIPANANGFIKPALRNLQRKGLALNRDESVGYWIFCDDFTPDTPYAGMTLTPSLAKEMVIEFFGGKTAQRKEFIEKLFQVHTERGGKSTPIDTINNAFKTAIDDLREEGFADNPSRGYWRIYLDPIAREQQLEPESPQSSESPTQSDSDQQSSEPTQAYKTKRNTSEDNTGVVDVGKTIGNGEDCVYVYYYPICREYAELKGQSVFACKIGNTTTTAIERVQSQLNESTFQYPEIGLTIRTNNRQTLEDLIHKTLKLHGKELTTAHGKEWFITSPAEVERIYKFIMKI